MIWITRGTKPKLNRDTGQIATGDFDSRVAGPDGISNSAMKFTGEDFIQIPLNSDINGDVTFQFNYKLAKVSTIPVLPPGTSSDGNDLDGAERIGGLTEYIYVNRAKARFEFYCNSTISEYLNSDGWSVTEPSDPVSPALEMGIWLDIDRSCWLFIIDGALIGVVNCNVSP